MKPSWTIRYCHKSTPLFFSSILSALIIISCAFSVYDGRPALIVLLLLNPHLLESGERGEDGASDPDRVFAFRRSDDFDGHRVGGQRLDLLLHSLRNALVHGGASGHHHVAIQILPDVDVALHDRSPNRARFGHHETTHLRAHRAYTARPMGWRSHWDSHTTLSALWSSDSVTGSA